MSKFKPVHSTLSDVLENGLPTSESKFVKLLLSHYTVNELYGKAIKDKEAEKTIFIAGILIIKELPLSKKKTFLTAC